MATFIVVAVPPGMTFPLTEDEPVALTVYPSTEATPEDAVEAARVALPLVLTVEPGMRLLPIPAPVDPPVFVMERTDVMVEQ